MFPVSPGPVWCSPIFPVLAPCTISIMFSCVSCVSCFSCCSCFSCFSWFSYFPGPVWSSPIFPVLALCTILIMFPVFHVFMLFMFFLLGFSVEGPSPFPHKPNRAPRAGRRNHYGILADHPHQGAGLARKSPCGPCQGPPCSPSRRGLRSAA